MKKSEEHRNQNLDVLRIIAVFLVLMRHAWWPDCTGPEIGGELWRSIFWKLRSAGWMGVDLFFVLSGFLVSGLLFKEHIKRGRLGYKRFFIRRAFKIYPPFLTLVVMTVIVELLLGREVNGRAVLSELAFLQNYYLALWNHTWSLAVEEHFYLILPTILMMLMLAGRAGADCYRRIPWVVGLFAVTALILRCVNSFREFSYSTHIAPTHLRIDSLWCGVLVSYIFHYRSDLLNKLSRWRWLLLAVGSVLMMPPFLRQIEQSIFLITFGFTIVYLGASCLLVALLYIQLGNRWLVRSMARLGSYSYSIYLWHMPVHTWGNELINNIFGINLCYSGRVIVYLVLSLGLGVLLSKLIEYPALRIRDRLFPSQAC